MTRRSLLFLLGAAGFIVPAVAAAHRPRSNRSMIGAARLFLASLDEGQRQKILFPLNDEERLNWHFVPQDRKGLPYKEMNETQRKLAQDLLRAGLSAAGFQKAETIRQLELVLREMENGALHRDPDRYFFTLFGAPSPDGIWGWRYEGHHCSQNWTLYRGKAVATTPQFFGSNPGEVRSGPMQGTRVLGREEDLGRSLVQSLNPAQRQVAILSPTAPPEIITGNERQVAIGDETGIPYAQLNPDQQGMLLTLIGAYAGAQPEEIARERLEKIHREGLPSVRFAWLGGLEKGDGHYYRIQGKTFLIEYDNTQNNANHIHTVWRDFKGDFGRDVLAEHYHEYEH